LKNGACGKHVRVFNVLLNLTQGESVSEDTEEHQEEEQGEVYDVQVFADEKFDPEFRVSTWEQTILGKQCEFVSFYPMYLVTCCDYS